MSEVLEIVAWLLIIFSSRMVYIPAIAFYQRNGLRLALRGRLHDPVDATTWRKKFDLYSQTSFDEHVWRLTTFRDPWKAYHADLAEDILEAK